MKIVSINTCTYGSTGKIMLQITELVNKQGEGYVAVPKGRHYKTEYNGHFLPIGGRFAEDSHIFLGRLTGLQGFFSYFSTKRFLKKVALADPDIIHLHNLHNSYINIPLLFKFIKNHDIPVVWTLHDCWSFTGHCPYFTAVNCNKWKTGCYQCSSCKDYPQILLDNTKTMWCLKKKWFTEVQNLTLVTPSKWLADLVKQSYFKEYPVKVINNGIDLDIFKYRENDFRKKYNIPESRKILLGVAFDWGYRKGLDVLIRLAAYLNKEEYQMVLVGTTNDIDKQLPDNVISIHRTENQIELAEIYSAADVFVNPTREDNYPTVNMEAIACGTPVITFDTGGSSESIDDTCGVVVPCNDEAMLREEIIRICSDKPYSREACIKHARVFDKNIHFQEYIDLYGAING